MTLGLLEFKKDRLGPRVFIPRPDRTVSVREAILDAAFDALLEEGPAFPVSSVGRRAEASKALVFHHFGSREGLLDAMAARVLAGTQDGLARLVEEEPEPRARLVALARALLALPPDPPRETRHVLQFWLEDDAHGGCRGGLRDALVADFVAATLREARALSEPREVAALLLARWHGATALYASGGAVDFDREQERLAAELQRLP